MLDVGCGAGGNAEALRAYGVEAIVGIEPVPEIAAAAALVYDTVHLGLVEDCLSLMKPVSNVVIAADVLEHTTDPEATLKGLRKAVARDAVLLVSVPNTRHISVLRMLFVRGQWEYRESGIMDRTHVRWFTRKSLVELLWATGWSVDEVVPKFNTARQVRWNAITRHGLQEFLAEQWLVRCSVRDTL